MIHDLIGGNNRASSYNQPPLARVFDQLFESPFIALSPMPLSREQQGFALDLSEDDHDYIVRASLPGFTEQDITAQVTDNVLTITAEKQEEKSDERYHRRERRWGFVERQVALPMPVQDELATAELAHGVLTLRLPKVRKAAPHRISISPDRPTSVRASVSTKATQG